MFRAFLAKKVVLQQKEKREREEMEKKKKEVEEVFQKLADRMNDHTKASEDILHYLRTDKSMTNPAADTIKPNMNTTTKEKKTKKVRMVMPKPSSSDHNPA